MGSTTNAILFVQLTGFGLNTSEGQANYTPDDGWGRYEWGYLGWGVNYANVTSFPSGSQINLSEGEVAVSGEIREGWGRLYLGCRMLGEVNKSLRLDYLKAYN
jgi:hypothetical protein